MNERKIIEQLMRATHGLAYWSGELLKVNAAIERHVVAGRANSKRRTTARKDANDVTTSS